MPEPGETAARPDSAEPERNGTAPPLRPPVRVPAQPPAAGQEPATMALPNPDRAATSPAGESRADPATTALPSHDPDPAGATDPLRVAPTGDDPVTTALPAGRPAPDLVPEQRQDAPPAGAAPADAAEAGPQPLPRRVRGSAQRGTPIPFQAPPDVEPLRRESSPGGAALFEPTTPRTSGFPEQGEGERIDDSPTLRTPAVPPTGDRPAPAAPPAPSAGQPVEPDRPAGNGSVEPVRRPDPGPAAAADGSAAGGDRRPSPGPAAPDARSAGEEGRNGADRRPENGSGPDSPPRPSPGHPGPATSRPTPGRPDAVAPPAPPADDRPVGNGHGPAAPGSRHGEQVPGPADEARTVAAPIVRPAPTPDPDIAGRPGAASPARPAGSSAASPAPRPVEAEPELFTHPAPQPTPDRSGGAPAPVSALPPGPGADPFGGSPAADPGWNAFERPGAPDRPADRPAAEAAARVAFDREASPAAEAVIGPAAVRAADRVAFDRAASRATAAGADPETSAPAEHSAADLPTDRVAAVRPAANGSGRAPSPAPAPSPAADPAEAAPRPSPTPARPRPRPRPRPAPATEAPAPAAAAPPRVDESPTVAVRVHEPAPAAAPDPGAEQPTMALRRLRRGESVPIRSAQASIDSPTVRLEVRSTGRSGRSPLPDEERSPVAPVADRPADDGPTDDDPPDGDGPPPGGSGGDDSGGDRPRRRRRFWLPTLGVVGVLALLYVGDLVFGSGSVPRGVTVAGVAIGGLSRVAAEQQLRSEIDARTGRPVAVRVGPASSEISPAAAGLAVDWPATLDAAAAQPLNPITRLTSFFTERPVPVTSRVDEGALTAALTELSPAVDTDPVEGGITFDGLTPVPVQPAPGQRLDVPAAAAVMRTGWVLPGPVVLPLVRQDPVTTPADVDRAVAEVARPAVSGPVTVLGENGVTATLTPEAIAAALSFRGQPGGLVPQLDQDAVVAALSPALAASETPGQDASLDFGTGKPVVTPSADGRGVDYPATIPALLSAMTAPGDRQATAVYGARPAALTTEQLGQLGITGVIGEFQTGGFAADSGRNIKRAAEVVNGTVVQPGETFSLNRATEPRDEAHGYVEAGVIDNGRAGRGVGGGVSQVATTLYNAAYFAGMTDVTHKEHSFYISRYPPGREATVVSGAVDMQFRNDGPTGVLIRTEWTPTTLTVRIYGTKRYEVTSTPGPRTDPTTPDTVTVPAGRPCVPSNGGPGFSITDTRTLEEIATGQVRTENRTVRYNPIPIVVCGT